jgi:Putative peptidoglycan binding domain
MMHGSQGLAHRGSRYATALALLVGAGVLGFWAGINVARTPLDPLADQAEQSSYLIQLGEVGREVTFTAAAEWVVTEGGRIGGSGVVTSVDIDGMTVVSSGTVLFSIDLRPVVAVVGPVPMFRDLGVRSEGADVMQLESFLRDGGYLLVEPDGVFGRGTTTAVKLWQKELGIKATGVVQRSDIVFFPNLPLNVFPSDQLRVGQRIDAGSVVVLQVGSYPEFTIPLESTQRAVVPVGAAVVIEGPAAAWDAEVGEIEERPDTGEVMLKLERADGQPICQPDCSSIPVGQRTAIKARVTLVPTTAGPVVPTAAISSNAANETFVTLTDGTLITVTVLSSANGLAVVEGVDAGTRVLLPGPPP